jgi:hypothetical protein
LERMSTYLPNELDLAATRPAKLLDLC